MATEYKLSYTASRVDKLLEKIDGITDLTEEEIAELCDFDGNTDNIIPVASKSSLGWVVAGDGLDVNDNGVMSVQSLTDEEIENICEFDEGMTEANIIPKATKTALGCIKVGDGLAIDSSGRLSAIMGDYIVETGTEGIWTYEKRNSGIMRAWGNVTTAPSGGCITNILLPTAFINEMPVINATCEYNSTDGVGHLATQRFGDSGAYKFHLYVRNVNDGNASTINPLGLSCEAIGRWK